MRRRALFLLALVTAMVLACAGVVVAQPDGSTPAPKEQQKEDPSERGQQRAGEVRPDHYIVVLKDDADPQQEAQKASEQHGAQVNRIYESAFRGFAGLIPSNRVDEVEADPNVEFVEQDVVMEAFAPSSKSKEGESTTSSSTTTSTDEVPTGVNRIKANGSTTGTLPGVAVIDTGIQTNHPDLNRVGGVNFVDGNPFRCGTKSGGGNDDNGHGTHVAGTVGAKSGNGGVVGVAPGAPLWAIKVLGSNGSGYLSDINCGIDWVTKYAGSYGIKVANMSLGGEGNLDPSDKCDVNTGQYTGSDSEHKAICSAVSKGITFVVAAGNSNKDLQNFRPAAYDEVLTVTAMADSDGKPYFDGAQWTTNNDCLKSDGTPRIDEEDSSANFSNWTTSGSSDESHTIAAPGVCIKSTWLSGGYKTISGTSMASPHTAGAVARCIAKRDCTGKPSDIISKLRTDAAAEPDSYGFTAEGGHSYAKLLYAGTY